MNGMGLRGTIQPHGFLILTLLLVGIIKLGRLVLVLVPLRHSFVFFMQGRTARMNCIVSHKEHGQKEWGINLFEGSCRFQSAENSITRDHKFEWVHWFMLHPLFINSSILHKGERGTREF